MISFLLIGSGLTFIGLYFFVFRVEAETVALTKFKPNGYQAGWNFGLLPSGTKYINSKRQELIVPIKSEGGLMRLRAPDAGIVGVCLTLIWSHDHNNANAYKNVQAVEETNSILQSRIQAALNYWIQGKPLPGTAKRALTSLSHAEQTIREKLTGVNPEALANRNEEYLGPDFMSSVRDLAIVIHEINITKMELMERGTDKPDWGDGDHIGFDAQAIFKQFHGHTDNLSNLRKLKDALMEKYPEEVDDIEDIYDQVRISMKETRDR